MSTEFSTPALPVPPPGSTNVTVSHRTNVQLAVAATLTLLLGGVGGGAIVDGKSESLDELTTEMRSGFHRLDEKMARADERMARSDERMERAILDNAAATENIRLQESRIQTLESRTAVVERRIDDAERRADDWRAELSRWNATMSRWEQRDQHDRKENPDEHLYQAPRRRR